MPTKSNTETLKLLRKMSPDERRGTGVLLTDTDRRKFAILLEEQRMIRQKAAPKSERFYAADSNVTRICDVLYANRTIDPVEVLDAADAMEGDDEMQEFRSLKAIQSAAFKLGCTVRKTTTSKSNVYYQVLNADRCIVGMFNEKPKTGRGVGHIVVSK